ncbi:MAG: 5-(carboxyamino)imidazole ribonucleotide synthase [Alphaproteobacteria bacterium]|nr:5-(carboxyamino)imidazole ribonucleotide synthase [Alphaproteobacteria bacterium]
MRPTALSPGATIGIVGGGQLGRMTALAAAHLGYRVHVYCEEADNPAARVAAANTVARYDDGAALARFARAIDVATCEFENVPARTIAAIAMHVPFRPGAAVFRICQDRLKEKDFVNAAGVPTAPYRRVDTLAQLRAALGEIGVPAILKTRRFGYDGKGQVRIADTADAAKAWASIGRLPAILEGLVRFRREVSVLVARGADGEVATYDPVENTHVDHILDTTIAPAVLSRRAATRARSIARRLAEGLDLVGLIAVEMFETRDGRLLVNELAPRPHNSGHWTIEGARTSQFEQTVRAVCGLPLGDPGRRANALMKNLVGHEIDAWPRLVADPALKPHHYGKNEVRAGRKVGHVTRLYPLDARPRPRDIDLGRHDRRDKE